MSPADKPDHARGWRYAQRLMDEEDDQRLKALTDAQLSAEVDAEESPAGEAGPEWSAEAMFARAQDELAKTRAAAVPAASVAEPPVAAPVKVAPVVPIRRRWVSITLSLAACVLIFFIADVAIQRFFPDEIVANPPRLTPEQAEAHKKADAMRDRAALECAEAKWALCAATLDEAEHLDPVGEVELRVEKMRGAIAGAKPGP